ncbi:MAG: indolepyruvate oxidoreductase subunit beta family protein [Rubrivivax sp.]|nr:indolepyruvate oxidoreductase subunit beta family protein [Rubrivivax sp.]
MSRPVCVLVCALGGEGGGVLAEWLYTAAVRAGHAAQATSIPGVAQRTGATTYYLEIAPQPAAPGAPRPVFSLSPVPGGVDLLVASELLEALRQAGQGFVSRARTRVVSSTTRALTVAEKMALGDGRADTARLLEALHGSARAVDLLDLDALAREAGTAMSAVMLGAIAGSGALPLPRQAYEEAIRAAGKGVQTSLAGFALAHDTLVARRGLPQPDPQPQGPLQQQRKEGRRAQAGRAGGKPAVAPHELRVLARQRVQAYQDEGYARLFDQRLARLQAAEAAARGAAVGADGPAGNGAARRPGGPTGLSSATAGPGVADEAARWLALWMCFDDIVQVARLKLATARLQRVRREVKAAPADVVKVYDHFKPGVAELAGLLPAAWAGRLVAWDRRRVSTGREPWALPLALGTHGLRGTLALRLVAAMKGLRRHGQRFALEQALIERWLAAVQAGTREHAALGLELARCGALVKGYGSTNERGKENLLHIVDHLAPAVAGGMARSVAERCAAVRAARQAALADDAGHAFDAALVAHHAPVRAPREQAVRWFKRRPARVG